MRWITSVLVSFPLLLKEYLKSKNKPFDITSLHKFGVRKSSFVKYEILCTKFSEAHKIIKQYINTFILISLPLLFGGTRKAERAVLKRNAAAFCKFISKHI